MENLSKDELCKTLDWIVQLASCPVCQETLTPEFALCIRGHTVCMSCRQQLQKSACPVCRDPFSGVHPTGFIRQVIESLPHPCRHKNCDYLVTAKDNHEKYCSYKLTNCHYCKWEGAQNEIVKHLEVEHTEVKKYFLPLVGKLENGISFNPKVQGSVFTPILADGHFFWGEMKNEPRLGKLLAVFHPLGNGKWETKTVFKGSVKMSDSFNADLTLNMDPEVDPYEENCISIPSSIVDKFTVDNKLCYRISVDVIPGFESLATWVDSTIKSGVELFGTVRDKFKNF